jgi:hypothetical protein
MSRKVYESFMDLLCEFHANCSLMQCGGEGKESMDPALCAPVPRGETPHSFCPSSAG